MNALLYINDHIFYCSWFPGQVSLIMLVSMCSERPGGTGELYISSVETPSRGFPRSMEPTLLKGSGSPLT